MGEVIYNILPLALENYQDLRENSTMNTVSFPRKEHLRQMGKLRNLQRFLHFYLTCLWVFTGGNPDGDLVWILSSDMSHTLSCAMVADSTALAMKL